MAQVYSGIQPSGELHIGNYLGAVKNWGVLQRAYPGAIFCVVTYHALNNGEDGATLRRRTFEMALSLLAAGVDPQAATLYVQSDVPEHTELAWIFNTITPVGELERQTQYKDKSAREESVPVGLLTYPVLQAADILLYKGDRVPVGEDQVQHLELSREIARKWNARFAPEDRPFFPEPQPLLTPSRRIMGLDGKAKMSKSLGNTINLSASADEVRAAVKKVYTDPLHLRVADPGHIEGNIAFAYLDAFDPEKDALAEMKAHYQRGGLADSIVKARLEAVLQEFLAPIRARRSELEKDRGHVMQILKEGTARAREVAAQTADEVKRAMGLSYF